MDNENSLSHIPTTYMSKYVEFSSNKIFILLGSICHIVTLHNHLFEDDGFDVQQ